MDTYRRIVEINIFGLLQALKKAAPLVRKGKGRIVTVTSGLARSPAASRSSYIITKYGGMGLMECVRYELKRFGVKVLTKVNLERKFLCLQFFQKNKLENSKFCPSLLGQKFFVRFLEELKKTKSPFEIN